MKSAADKLSPRQMQILAGIAGGKKRTVIASELGISFHTVNDYTKRMYRRLGCHSDAEAMAKYFALAHPTLPLF